MLREEWEVKREIAREELEDVLDGAISPTEISALAVNVTAKLYGERPDPDAPTPQVVTGNVGIFIRVGGPVGTRHVVLDTNGPRSELPSEAARALIEGVEECLSWIEEYGG